MQQATSPIGDLSQGTGNNLPQVTEPTRFVINLCASTTPVGLVQPSSPELKRFTFYVSRRREEGRERFRLHMGYFSSQDEAEKLLELVRDVYPAAWAGIAPGQRLRRGAAPPANPSAAPAPAPAPVAAAPVAAAIPAPAAPAIAVPTAATQAPAPAVAPIPVASPAAVAAAPAAAPVPFRLELVPDLPRPVTNPAGASAMPATGDAAAAHSLSNVRAAIDSLDDAARASPAESTPIDAEQALRVLESAPTVARFPPRTTPPAPGPSRNPPERAPAPAAKPGLAPAVDAARARTSGATVAPAATPARGEAALPPRTEPATYAVQLLWSVQPIDMSLVPQLAIFAAYTLYGAEGNRDGRRWYGLRLGFFTDAVSAKQVAQYVRSEFKSVSVVPVTAGERSRAGAASAKPLPLVPSAKGPGHELSFIEDVATDTATSGARPALKVPEPPTLTGIAAAAAAAGPLRAATAGSAPGKRAKLRVAQGTKPAPKRATHKGPLSFEETLEILGASQLEIEDGKGERINDSATHGNGATKPQRGSRFGRLMDRLAERFTN